MRRGQHIWPTDCYMKANSLKPYLWIESDRTHLDFDLSHQRAADHVSGMHLLFLSGLPCAERHPTRLATPGTVELAVLIALGFHPGHWRTFMLHLMDWSVGKIAMDKQGHRSSTSIKPSPKISTLGSVWFTLVQMKITIAQVAKLAKCCVKTDFDPPNRIPSEVAAEAWQFNPHFSDAWHPHTHICIYIYIYIGILLSRVYYNVLER